MRKKYHAKTDAEIILMRRAGLVTAAALLAVKSSIEPGMTTAQLDAIAEKTIRSMDGIPNFQLVPGYRHTVCASVNAAVVHGIPNDYRLQAGDIVSIDCGAEVNGWNGDSALTIVLPGGDPDVSAKRQELSDVCEQSLWAGIAAFAKASRLNEVGIAIEESIRARGDFGILEQYVGHGIGRSMHEDPAVFNYRVRDLGPRVESGLCIAIEPMITAGQQNTFVDSDEWTVKTEDGTDGAHWEHSIARHSKGVWVLTAEDGGAAGLLPFGITPVPLGQ